MIDPLQLQFIQVQQAHIAFKCCNSAEKDTESLFGSSFGGINPTLHPC